MSNPTSNAPMPGGQPSMFQTWINAVTKPNEQTFATIANSPGAKASTAYLWIFIGYLVEFFLSSLVGHAALDRALVQSGLNTGGFGGRSLVGILITAFCGAPILAVIFTFFLAIGTAIVQWIAKMFGGKGTYEQMIYTFAALFTPFFIASGVFSLLGAIPFIGFCFSILFLLALIYLIVLELLAVKGVNQFGWGPAIGALFIPGIVVAIVCTCVAVILVAALGPAISNIFQSINQSLPTQ